MTSVFTNTDAFDVWLRPKSVLIGKGDPKLSPRNDFNNTARNTRTVDVGAYETRNLATNPGWKVAPGFKQPESKRD
jgi:hypothetical protein